MVLKRASPTASSSRRRSASSSSVRRSSRRSRSTSTQSAKRLRERLERAPVTEANLEATAPVSGGEEAALDSQVTRLTQAALAPVGGAPVYRSGESEPLTQPAASSSSGSSTGSGTTRASSPGAGRATARSSSPRRPPRRSASTPATRSTRRAGLRAGRRVGARRGDLPGRPPVVGVLVEEPLATTGADAGELGPLVTTKRSFLSLGLQGAELRWRLEPSFHGLTIGQGEDLRRALQRLPGRLNQGRARRAGLGRDGAARTPAAATHSLHAARAGVLVPRCSWHCWPVRLLFTRPCCSSGAWSRPRASACAARAPGRSRMAFVEAALISILAAIVAPWLAAAACTPQLGRAARGHRAAPRPEGAASAFALAAAAVRSASRVRRARAAARAS